MDVNTRGLVVLTLLSFAGPAYAQDEDHRRRIAPEGVEVDVERTDRKNPHSEPEGPRAKRTEPSRFRTAVDPAWGDFDPPDSLEKLRERLVTPDPLTRRDAAKEIAGAGELGVRFLISLLGDGDLRVEDAAEHALAELPAGSAPLVGSGLVHPHFRVRSRSARVLGRMGGGARSALPTLLAAIYDENSFVRESAVRALPAVGGEGAEVVDALVAALADPDSFVRFRAAAGLARPGPAAERAIGPLGESLALERDHSMLCACARALGAISRPADRVALALARGLASGDAAVVEEVESILGRHLEENPDALPALEGAAADATSGQEIRAFLQRRR